MDLAPQRRLAAIMFTDIVGYSRLMGADEARAMRLLDRHDAILGEQVRAHGGEILKKMGDSVFASFRLGHECSALRHRDPAGAGPSQRGR
jgi:class 3 adenylate cyclase